MQVPKLNGVKITGPTCTKSLGVAASARRSWVSKHQGCSQTSPSARNYHATPQTRLSISQDSTIFRTRESLPRLDLRSTEGASNRRTLSTSPTRHSSLNTVSRYYVPRFNTTSTPVPRRTSLTAGEGRALEEMFSAIYNAANFQERQDHDKEHGDGTSPSFTMPSQQATFSLEGSFNPSLKPSTSRLISSAKPTEVRWVRAGDEILDVKREEINLCQNDHDLHNWVIENLFEPFKPYDRGSSLPVPALPNGTMAQAEPLPAYIYAQLLSVVMRTFRTRYQDPHTALAVFDHVRNASVASYVACCGTAAYNELIETEWDSFRNLRGVYEALEEMKLNKVRIDTRTQVLVENLRRQVGHRSTWQEDGFGESPAETIGMLEKIEKSFWTAPTSQRPDRERADHRYSGAKWKMGSEAWKIPAPQKQDALELV